MRIGQGYDVHALVLGRRLILGGVEIAHSKGLQGHSDADVLLHAIMDSLLGAAGLGDIGVLFPDTGEQWRDACSLELLNIVAGEIARAGYKVVNIDSTIIAQKPKLQPFFAAMKENIADALGVSSAFVNLKATTEEYLGFTGREEGISVYASVLLNKI